MAPQRILYNTIVPFLTGSLKLFSRAFPRLRTFFEVRKNLFAELEKHAGNPTDKVPRIWIHAASAGEFEQARPIITRVKKALPDASIFISFQSDSGYTLYRHYADVQAVFYHPVDTKKNAEKTVALIRPDVVMVMRYDFWPNHLSAAKKDGAILILAAAVLQEHSIYFKPFVRQFYQYVFSLFDCIFTVSENDRKRFAETFKRNDALKAGDPRFDQALQRSSNTGNVGPLKKLYAKTTLLVAGSTWEKDESLLLPAYASFAEALGMILVPHDVSPVNIARLEKNLESAGIPFAKFSTLPDDFSADRVLIIDRIGLLAELYDLATIAYVGGGFGVNVHNTLEAAVYGIPVLFGPNYHNSPEAEELLRIAGATEIHDGVSLLHVLKKLLENPETRRAQGTIAGNFVRNHLGASEIVAEKILSTLDGLSM